MKNNNFLISEKTEKSENENEEENDSEKTAKIQYKNIQKIFTIETKKENFLDKKNKFYWFAAYDKLMRTKNIKKIFSFYEKEKEENSLININNTYISINNFNKKIVKFFYYFLINFFRKKFPLY